MDRSAQRTTRLRGFLLSVTAVVFFAWISLAAAVAGALVPPSAHDGVTLLGEAPEARLDVDPATLRERPRKLALEVVGIHNPQNVAFTIRVEAVWRDAAEPLHVASVAPFPADAPARFLLDTRPIFETVSPDEAEELALVFFIRPIHETLPSDLRVTLAVDWIPLQQDSSNG